jgi:hypothetical protein
MIRKCSKKLVLLKTFYYRVADQDVKPLSNYVYYNTNPITASDSSIRYMTDKNFNPIDTGFFEFTTIHIPANNSISGITKQTFQETLMLKTKCGFVSANTFYFDNSSNSITSIPSVDYSVTATSGYLKNAVKVTIEYDNDGITSWSNGVKFTRRVFVYGYACK